MHFIQATTPYYKRSLLEQIGGPGELIWSGRGAGAGDAQ
jgi:hypothetical protein